MNAKQLYDWLKAYKHKTAEVYICLDDESCDEDGNLDDLHRVNSIFEQTQIVDMGVEFEDRHEVVIQIDKEKAGSCIDGVII